MSPALAPFLFEVWYHLCKLYTGIGLKQVSTDNSQDKINVLLDWTGLPSTSSSENIELGRIPNFIVRKNTSFTRSVTGTGS